MRFIEERTQGYDEPIRIFPRRLLEWVFQVMGISAIFLALLTLANNGMFDLHISSFGPNLRKGSLDPIDHQASTVNHQRRLLQESDKLVGRHRYRGRWQRDLSKILRAFHPFNISGSYTGYGDLSKLVDGKTRNSNITNKLQIRTTLTRSPRYHAVQLQIVISGIPDELMDNGDVSTILPDMMLDVIGIYDAAKGSMQGIANSPTFPPKLPMFKNKKITFPKSNWFVSPKSSFHFTRCPFLVNVSTNNISRHNFMKENSRRPVPNFGHRGKIDVHLKTTIQSMDRTCSNITLGIMHSDLLRYDLFILKSSRYAVAAISLSLIQILLVYRQIQFSTPANIATKFSLISVAMHTVFDAYISLLHLTIALYIDDLFYPFIAVFFLQFLIFSILDLRLILLVWRGRRPIDFSSGWERVRSTITKIYLCFYGGVFISLLFLYSLRNRMNQVVFLLFAFWVPQIVHNIKTGDKFAVLGRFLFGLTAIRLFFPLYFYGFPLNFLEMPTNTTVVVGLLVLAGIQVFLLKGMDTWGSRFFIPKRLQSDYYEYHQNFEIDPEDYDSCAICMKDIVSSTKDRGKQDSSEDYAKNVLTTPCNHRFCQECLIRWMETKMICPTCRGVLPPYN